MSRHIPLETKKKIKLELLDAQKSVYERVKDALKQLMGSEMEKIKIQSSFEYLFQQNNKILEKYHVIESKEEKKRRMIEEREEEQRRILENIRWKEQQKIYEIERKEREKERKEKLKRDPYKVLMDATTVPMSRMLYRILNKMLTKYKKIITTNRLYSKKYDLLIHPILSRKPAKQIKLTMRKLKELKKTAKQVLVVSVNLFPSYDDFEDDDLFISDLKRVKGVSFVEFRPTTKKDLLENNKTVIERMMAIEKMNKIIQLAVETDAEKRVRKRKEEKMKEGMKYLEEDEKQRIEFLQKEGRGDDEEQKKKVITRRLKLFGDEISSTPPRRIQKIYYSGRYDLDKL